jgi:hypothetical protein
MVYTFPFMWDQLMGTMMNSIFGNPLLTGAIVLLFFYILTLALRMTLEMQMVCMLFVSFLVVGIYITWFPTIIFLGVGMFIGLFLYYMIFSR